MSTRTTNPHGRVPRRGEQLRFQRALIHEACELGLRIADGAEAGIPQHETTVTETVLLNLHQRLGPRLMITPLTQSEEGRKGADWIWCVGDSQGWFSFYVQAKKLKGGGYDIGYRTRGAQQRQVDKLIRTSTAARVMPVHVLYNPASEHVDYSGRGCRQLLPDGADSFTYVSALTARGLLAASPSRTVTLDQIRPYAHPWSCLARCPDEPVTYWSPMWPPGLMEGLPALFRQPGVPGTMARIAMLSLLEAASDEAAAFEVGDAIEVVQELVLRSFSERPPLWLDDPDEMLSAWRQAVRFADEQTSYDLGIGDELPEPSVVVSQRF